MISPSQVPRESFLSKIILHSKTEEPLEDQLGHHLLGKLLPSLTNLFSEQQRLPIELKCGDNLSWTIARG